MPELEPIAPPVAPSQAAMDRHEPFAPRPPAALYVHVPFCLSLCPYCDFVVYTGRAARGPASRVGAFLEALHAELDLRANALDDQFGAPRSAPSTEGGNDGRPALRSIYLGGGTPSLLPARDVGALLDHVERRFGIDAGAEITIQANPGPLDRGDLAGFRSAGVTRLSLGAQSLQAPELRRLGRRHAPRDVGESVRGARAAGFRNVSVDLLTDVPGQTLGSWRDTLGAVLALEVDHVSTYALTLDDPEADGLTGPLGDHLPLRPGARRWRKRAVAEQDDERLVDLDAAADELLGASGFRRYEIANHARAGHESRHNLAYWCREPYEAIGPGAHAFDGGRRRRWNAARLDAYLSALRPGAGSTTAALRPGAGSATGAPRPEAGSATGARPGLPPGGTETLDDATAIAESVILGLRLDSGIRPPLALLPAVGPVLDWAIANALAERHGEAVRLTPRGRLLSNEVFLRLLPDRRPT
jgi:putative oxygen-independent coproporphyrinogen III oxidase